MRVVSVNVGLPREVNYRGRMITSGIFKEPVDGSVQVKKLNLDGDRQADLTVHGGPNKAVYGYPLEHYDYWREELGVELRYGMFGENLTTEGLSEDKLNIGDEFRVGTTLLRVVQPRMPCYKLAMKFDRDDMIKRFLDSRKSGFYFSVVEEGEVSAGAEIVLLKRAPENVTVSDITDLFAEHGSNHELLDRAVKVEALPESWREWLMKRAQPAG